MKIAVLGLGVIGTTYAYGLRTWLAGSLCYETQGKRTITRKII